MTVKSGSLFLLAATCAILFGLLEGLEIILVRGIPWIEPMRKTSLDVVWVAPALHLVVNGAIATLLALAVRARLPVTTKLAAGAFAFVGIMGVTRYTGTVGLPGCIVLSAGAAIQVGRMIGRQPSTASLLRVLAGLAVLVVIAMFGLQISRSWSPRKTPNQSAPRPGAPNVLVIVMDTVRADRLSIHGYAARTPTIERLAGEGAMFDWAIATSSWTLPSHASLLTGLSPGQHGAVAVDAVLSPAHSRLQEQFEVAGYRTGAFVANNIFIIPEHGFAPGFQVFEAHYVRSLAARTTWGRVVKAVGRRFLNWELDPFRPAETITRAFDNWVGQSDGRPFFAVMNWMDAHDPYHPGTRRPDVRRWSRRERWTDADRAQLAIDYDDAIAHMDAELGRLRTKAIEDGWWDNTLLILLADHGEAMADGSFEHGTALTLEQIHVPLVIRFPGKVPAGVRVAEPVSVEDVASTVMALTGLDVGRRLPGTSLTDFFLPGPGVSREPAPVMSALTDVNYMPPLNLKSIVADGFQFVYDVNASTAHLYALSDTAGRVDLSGQPELAGVMNRAREALRVQESSRR